MVESVLKAFRIMELFTYEQPRLTLAEIARRMEMPKSTVHNLLGTLKSIDCIEKLDDDTYALGIGFLPLTQYLRVNVEIRDRAAPLLRDLADACGESVYLAVLERTACRFIYVIETSRRLQARSALGGVAPLHSSGIGKAILAFLPAGAATEIVAQTGLPGVTPQTIVSRARLQKEMETIRERGYSTDGAENEEGTYCVGAPILDARGRPIAGCSLSGTDPHIVDKKLDNIAACVTYTAQEISRRMGYVPRKVSSFDRGPVNPLTEYRKLKKSF